MENFNQRKRFAAALVKKTEFNENISLAINSILNNSQYFTEVHIEYAAYQDGYEFYKGWTQDKAELGKYGIKIIIHPIFDVNKVERLVLVEIPSCCDIKVGAMETLFEDISKKENSHIDFYAFEAEIVVEKEKGVSFFNNLFYGFFIIGFFIDWLRSLISLKKYDNSHFVRVYMLQKRFGGTVLPCKQWLRIFRNTNQYPTKFIGNSCVINQVPCSEQTLPYILRWFKYNPNLYFGFWNLCFFIYYILFSFPWWSPFIPSTRLSLILNRGLFDRISLTFYLIHLFFLYFSCVNSRFYFPAQILCCILYPFYLMFLPLFMVFGKFYKPSSTKIISKKKKRE